MKATILMRNICTFLFLLFSTIGNSQELDATVRLTEVPNVDSVFNANYIIILPDTQNVTDIEYKLGITVNYELLNSTLSYSNIPSVQGTGTVFRNGNKIFVSLGEIPKYPNYFGFVRWKSNNGVWSDPFQFIFN